MLPTVLDIATLRAGYAGAAFTPLDVVEEVLRRIEAYPDPAVWISRVDAAALRRAARALGGRPDDRPLWGIPYAVKDNIDCVELDTTAACPAFAYRPAVDASVVAKLKAAGTLLTGKTNLDQFATGLNGTRSPYGAPRCVFNADYISGGSSSGSAVAVAAGLVSFALGTDTAGSGRVPAAFNNLVGIKPTRGLLSTRGVVPACRSLDCVTVLAATVGDGDAVRRVMQGFDAGDPYSRVQSSAISLPRKLRVGVLPPVEREFFGDAASARFYEDAIERLRALDAEPVEFDYAPFREAAESLYGGPTVAERLAGIRSFYETQRETIEATVVQILDGARGYSAADLFDAQHRLQTLRRRADAEWKKVDVLMLPTAPTIYTVAAMHEQPIGLNTRLGRYTNFVNLFDCCAVAVPAGFTEGGLPFGVTLIAPAFHDDALAALADRVHRAQPFGMGIARDAVLPAASRVEVSASSQGCAIAVVGAHLSGMPLNRELTSAGGTLLRAARTAPDYRLYVLPNTTPAKPGLVRAPGFAGPGIELEVWSLDASAFGAFVARIPAPLGIGKVRLDDGSEVSGFLCEAYAVAGAAEITDLGGWRNYVQRSKGSLR
jgi:allophanate hydrolase